MLCRERGASVRRTVSFSEAFRFWVKLGFISFGGPAGQIAIMHRELVDRRRWLSEERFLHALNYCMLLPGPEAQQLATYIGWLLHRTPGGLVAGGFFILPSVLILLALSYSYAAFGHTLLVVGVLTGFKPVVVAIVVEAVFRIGRRALKRRVHVLIAAVAFMAIYVLHVPFPLIVVGAAAIGWAGGRLWPDGFGSAAAGGAAVSRSPGSGTSSSVGSDAGPAIDDDGAPPPHTRPSTARALRTLAIALLFWGVPFAAVVAWRGWNSLHAEMYRFFSVAALVTFGGAYSVLAYVTQAAVVSYGWLSHGQAVDGLALAETTPGPLIMVLQFVGFIGAWNTPGGLSPACSAVVGALLTTYATFLPSFFFIFVGAPYIEVLRGNERLRHAMTGITAAVVGVVLNLALVFGAAVIWPSGAWHDADLFALALTVVAFLALYHFQLDVTWVVAGGGMAGLAWCWIWG